MSTLWSDDFESGAAIGVHYSLSPGGHCKTDATCGRGGGWGVLSDIKTYHAWDEYSDYFVYEAASATEAPYWRMEIDTDWSYLSQGNGSPIFEMVGVYSGSWRYLDLCHKWDGDGNPGLQLYISNDVEGPDVLVGDVADAGIVIGTWQRIRLEVWFSTFTGGVPNADGRAKVWIDNTCVISMTGHVLVSKAYGGTPPDAHMIGEADIFTMGAYDNFLLTTDPLPSATWVDVPNFKREWIDASRFPGGAARCLCMLWATDAGVNVQARLVSLLADGETVDAVVGTSADITATDPTDATFAVALTVVKRHKLQLTSSTPLTDLWCAPGAKVAP